MLLDAARRIADEVLFPAAEQIDAAPAVDRRYLDELAAAGLYDLAAGTDGTQVIEALGGASLVTVFVWVQHHSPVRAVAAAGGPLADKWLSALRRGEVRAGIAYAALRRPGPPAAMAEPDAGGGWRVSGHAPWVTGWGRIDIVLAGARHGEDMVWALLDATESPGMSARPVRLAALDASATVEVTWDRYTVPPERVVAVEPYRDWRLRDRAGLANNGYLAIGVAARCARILESESLGSEVDGARRALDESTPATVVESRVNASLLAVRAATAVVAAGGGRSMEAGTMAARLMREATFLLVFGQTPEIRASQAEALGAN